MSIIYFSSVCNRRHRVLSIVLSATNANESIVKASSDATFILSSDVQPQDRRHHQTTRMKSVGEGMHFHSCMCDTNDHVSHFPSKCFYGNVNDSCRLEMLWKRGGNPIAQTAHLLRVLLGYQPQRSPGHVSLKQKDMNKPWKTFHQQLGAQVSFGWSCWAVRIRLRIHPEVPQNRQKHTHKKHHCEVIFVTRRKANVKGHYTLNPTSNYETTSVWSGIAGGIDSQCVISVITAVVSVVILIILQDINKQWTQHEYSKYESTSKKWVDRNESDSHNIWCQKRRILNRPSINRVISPLSLPQRAWWQSCQGKHLVCLRFPPSTSQAPLCPGDRTRNTWIISLW